MFLQLVQCIHHNTTSSNERLSTTTSLARSGPAAPWLCEHLATTSTSTPSTLLPLPPLISDTIIGLLATLSIIALNTARAKARDAKRIGDIKQIQTALELYYNDNNSYPSSLEILTEILLRSVKATTTKTIACPALTMKPFKRCHVCKRTPLNVGIW